MSMKEQFAKMQIQAELETTLAALVSYGQHIDSHSDYGKLLKKIQEDLSKQAALAAALAE